MIGIDITIKDTARPAVQAFISGMQPGPLAEVAGRSARNVIRDYLFAYNGNHANRLGGARTNYYTGAARATQFRVEGDTAIVSINQIGFAQRYYGGTITPKKAKYLTIPARAEAYGHRASEFQDLIVVFGKNGPFALARAVSTQIGFSRPSKATGRRTVSNKGEQGGEIMFWLVKSATQQPNSEVIPSDAELGRQINKDVLDYALRLWERRTGIPPTEGGSS